MRSFSEGFPAGPWWVRGAEISRGISFYYGKMFVLFPVNNKLLAAELASSAGIGSTANHHRYRDKLTWCESTVLVLFGQRRRLEEPPGDFSRLDLICLDLVRLLQQRKMLAEASRGPSAAGPCDEWGVSACCCLSIRQNPNPADGPVLVGVWSVNRTCVWVLAPCCIMYLSALCWTSESEITRPEQNYRTHPRISSTEPTRTKTVCLHRDMCHGPVKPRSRRPLTGPGLPESTC